MTQNRKPPRASIQVSMKRCGADRMAADRPFSDDGGSTSTGTEVGNVTILRLSPTTPYYAASRAGPPTASETVVSTVATPRARSNHYYTDTEYSLRKVVS